MSPPDCLATPTPKRDRPDLSVVIVNWNTRKLLLDCVRSIYETVGTLQIETLVVDNGSTDDSVKALRGAFPQAIVIENKKNLGFAAGNNVGLRQAQGRCVALVNSDVVVLPECFQELISVLRTNPRIGLVGPMLLNADGSIQISAKRLPTLWNSFCPAVGLNRLLPSHPWFSGTEFMDLTADVSRIVPMLAGAFWVMPRATIEKVGFLDESFFFYGEDADWCKRVAGAGLQTLFFPKARAIHLGGGSSSAEKNRFRREHHIARMRYWSKHRKPLATRIFQAICLLHHAVRLAGDCLCACFHPRKRSECKHRIADRWKVLCCVFEISPLALKAR